VWTFDFIRLNFIHAERSLWDELVEIQYDGRRLGDVVLEMKSPSPNEIQISQKHKELRILTTALIRADYHPISIHSQERPDFAVDLKDEGTIYVEVAEAIGEASARYHNTIFDLLRDLRDAVDADSQLASALANHYVTFTLGDVPSKTDRTGALTEMTRFIANEDLSAYDQRRLTPLPQTYPILAQLSSRVIVIPGPGPVMVTSTAHAFNPDDLTRSALGILTDKGVKAAGYTGSPLWVVIGMTDLSGFPDMSLDQFASINPRFAPFARLIVTADTKFFTRP